MDVEILLGCFALGKGVTVLVSSPTAHSTQHMSSGKETYPCAAPPCFGAPVSPSAILGASAENERGAGAGAGAMIERGAVVARGRAIWRNILT